MQLPLSVRPSVRLPVRPSRYLLLNHWTKSNQIWCVSCSHEWGVQQLIFFCPAPWGPGEAPKGQISLNIIKIQLQSQFQRFLNQCLCVFSQMKDIKHIRRDIILPPGMLQGWDFGVPWGVGEVKKKFWNSTRFFVWVTYMNGTCNSTIFFGPRPLGPSGGAKRSNIIKSELQIQFQRFSTKLCVSSHKWKIYNISDRISFGRLGHAQGWDLGVPWGGGGGGLGVKFYFSSGIKLNLVCELLTWIEHAQFFGSLTPGALGRGQKFNFHEMVMWHIKLKGMHSRPGFTEKFWPTIKLVTLG